MKNYIVKESKTKLHFNANTLEEVKQMFKKQFTQVIYLDKNGR